MHPLQILNALGVDPQYAAALGRVNIAGTLQQLGALSEEAVRQMLVIAMAADVPLLAFSRELDRYMATHAIAIVPTKVMFQAPVVTPEGCPAAHPEGLCKPPLASWLPHLIQPRRN